MGANLIVELLVLGTTLLALTGLAISFVQQRPAQGFDESGIRTAAQLDAALSIQRSMRIAELQGRMTERNHWSYVLFGLAFLRQMTALAVDHLAHPSIATITILPAFFVVLTARAARRREAQRKLESCIASPPVA
jgi:hypothetical protein